MLRLDDAEQIRTGLRRYSLSPLHKTFQKQFLGRCSRLYEIRERSPFVCTRLGSIFRYFFIFSRAFGCWLPLTQTQHSKTLLTQASHPPGPPAGNNTNFFLGPRWWMTQKTAAQRPPTLAAAGSGQRRPLPSPDGPLSLSWASPTVRTRLYSTWRTTTISVARPPDAWGRTLSFSFPHPRATSIN